MDAKGARAIAAAIIVNAKDDYELAYTDMLRAGRAGDGTRYQRALGVMATLDHWLKGDWAYALASLNGIESTPELFARSIKVQAISDARRKMYHYDGRLWKKRGPKKNEEETYNNRRNVSRDCLHCLSCGVDGDALGACECARIRAEADGKRTRQRGHYRRAELRKRGNSTDNE